MSKKGFTNHLYAENREEAIEATRRQFPNHVIGEATLDPDWSKTKYWDKRWAVKVTDAQKGRRWRILS
jgi:hypothetical protein